MYCPYCSKEDTKVVDSRLGDNGESVRRRRVCLHCNERFTTFENVIFEMPVIVKTDGRREKFQEVKLRRGISRAFEKRSFSSEVVEGIVKKIMRAFTHRGNREIAVDQIGEAVMYELRQIDEVAYVRFASVYRQFQDVSEFSKELNKLRESTDNQKIDAQLSTATKLNKH